MSETRNTANDVALLQASLRAMKQQRNTALDALVATQASHELTQAALDAAVARVTVTQQQWTQTKQELTETQTKLTEKTQYITDLESINEGLTKSNSELLDKLTSLKSAMLTTPKRPANKKSKLALADQLKRTL